LGAAPMDLKSWTSEWMRAFAETMDAIRDRKLGGFDAHDLCDAAVQIYLKRNRLPDHTTVAKLEASARASLTANLALGNLPNQNIYMVVCVAFNACAVTAKLIPMRMAQDSMVEAGTMAQQLESGKMPASEPPPVPVPSTRKAFFEDIRTAWIKSRTMYAIQAHDDQIFRVASNDEVGLALVHSFGERGFGQNLEDYRFLLGQLHDEARTDLAGLSSSGNTLSFRRFAICFIRFHALVRWLPKERAERLIADVYKGLCAAPQ
jgi:hypothetical protein